MLRKRTAFKPNLRQAAPAPQPPPLETLVTKDNDPKNALDNDQQSLNPSTSATNNEFIIANDTQQQTKPASNPIDTSKLCNIQELQPTITDISSERVQEAITQLTGQKFEPIKSLSLRSSVNKNVKLRDLLFFNPPMTKDQKRHKKSVILAKKNELKKVRDDDSKTAGDKEGEEEKREEPSLIPKVKMGPEGKLVLDESSTIINRRNSIKEKEAIVEDNEDIISRTNYDSFRRKPTNTSQTKWSLADTEKFYHALTILGTDFSMMESLLFAGARSRTELHKKFKREERVNKLKVDIALSNRISLNSEELEEIFYNS